MAWGIRLLRLMLPLALGAGALVGGPGLMGAAGAAAQPCTVAHTDAAGQAECGHARSRKARVPRGSAALLAVLTDTDSDGLDDLVDGCPTVASSNPTGCPSASRSVALRWLAGKKRLQARVSSSVAGCSRRARIALWRVRPNRDDKVFGGAVGYGGRLRIAVPRGATYYVTVSPSYASGVAECGQAESRKVFVPRR